MRRRFLKLFFDQLHHGITPEKLAISAALGMALGIFPVLGSTTLLCALAGFLFGLNQPVIQAVNYIMYPIQIALLIPFYRLGERLFNAPKLMISAEGVKFLIGSGVLNAIHLLWNTTMRAIVAWCLLAPWIVAGVYFISLMVFRRWRKGVLI